MTAGDLRGCGSYTLFLNTCLQKHVVLEYYLYSNYIKCTLYPLRSPGNYTVWDTYDDVGDMRDDVAIGVCRIFGAVRFVPYDIFSLTFFEHLGLQATLV